MNYYVIVFQTDWNLSLEKCIQKSIKLKENMLENGADGAVMSGSGPTVYGLTQKNDKPGMYIMQSMVVVMKSILQDY